MASKDSLNDGMVLPPKAVPIPEPDLPLWEEATSVASSQTETMTNLEPLPLTGGGLILCLVVVLVRRLLNWRRS